MKIKKRLVIESMNKYVDILLDDILKECNCECNTIDDLDDDLEFETKSGKKVTLLSDEDECECEKLQ